MSLGKITGSIRPEKWMGVDMEKKVFEIGKIYGRKGIGFVKVLAIAKGRVHYVRVTAGDSAFRQWDNDVPKSAKIEEHNITVVNKVVDVRNDGTDFYFADAFKFKKCFINAGMLIDEQKYFDDIRAEKEAKEKKEKEAEDAIKASPLYKFAESIDWTDLFATLRKWVGDEEVQFEIPVLKINKNSARVFPKWEVVNFKTERLGIFGRLLDEVTIEPFYSNILDDEGEYIYTCTIHIHYTQKKGGSNSMELGRATYKNGVWTYDWM